MKKCSFLSPEALLQAEIFGSGNSGGGGTSSIVDGSQYFTVDTGSRSMPIIEAYYDTVSRCGLFYVSFTSESSECYISVSGITNITFGEFMSSNNTATTQGHSSKITFSTVSSSENITVIGRFVVSDI